MAIIFFTIKFSLCYFIVCLMYKYVYNRNIFFYCNTLIYYILTAKNLQAIVSYLFHFDMDLSSVSFHINVDPDSLAGTRIRVRFWIQIQPKMYGMKLIIMFFCCNFVDSGSTLSEVDLGSDLDSARWYGSLEPKNCL